MLRSLKFQPVPNKNFVFCGSSHAQQCCVNGMLRRGPRGGGWLRASSKSVSPHAPSSAKYFLLRACGHVVARTLLGLAACRARGSCNQGCSIRNLLDLASRLYRCCSQRDSSTSDLLLIRNTANLSPVTCDHPSRPSVFVPTVVCDMPFLIKKSVEVPGAQPAVC